MASKESGTLGRLVSIGTSTVHARSASFFYDRFKGSHFFCTSLAEVGKCIHSRNSHSMHTEGRQASSIQQTCLITELKRSTPGSYFRHGDRCSTAYQNYLAIDYVVYWHSTRSSAYDTKDVAVHVKENAAFYISI